MGRIIVIGVGIVAALAGGFLVKHGIFSSASTPPWPAMPGINGRRGRSRRRSQPQPELAEVGNGQPYEGQQSY